MQLPGTRYNFTFFFILVIAFLFPAPVKAQINAEQVIIIGRNIMALEDYMLAIQYFNQAIKAKPYLADAYLYRAIAKINLEDYEGAEEDATLAIEKNEFKPEAYKVRGFARQATGKDSLAIVDYNRGLELKPLEKYLLFYESLAYDDLKKYNQADSVLSVLLNYYPQFEDGFNMRAKTRLELGDTVAALNDLNKSLAISKDQINPYLMMAEVSWKRSDWENAGDAINKAIRIRPDIEDLYVNRAYIKYNSDDFYGAMDDYNYALQLNPLNISARFNRGLLRYEVKDLANAVADMDSVLKIDPSNFHALYNKALINLELNNYNESISDFKSIASRYPSYYPIYYALAEAEYGKGNYKSASEFMHKADLLVEKYVENPDVNKLDKPGIIKNDSNSLDPNRNNNEEDSEMEVMEKFNRLVTVKQVEDRSFSFNDQIKGRVQDRDVNAVPEPLYVISFFPAPESIRNSLNLFKEIDDLNNLNLIKYQFYLSPELNGSNYDDLFDIASELASRIKGGFKRPVDYLAAGVAFGLLKNYKDASGYLNEAIDKDPRFTLAYMARGSLKFDEAVANDIFEKNMSQAEKDEFDFQLKTNLLKEAIDDFDHALDLNPRLSYAWYDKGNIYYYAQDYETAINCYNRAIDIEPSLAPAFYNRGLSYLHKGNRQAAFNDLSKAGELGIVASYNILKRMK